MEEPANETIDSLREKIYWLLADTVDNPVASERLAAAKSLGIYIDAEDLDGQIQFDPGLLVWNLKIGIVLMLSMVRDFTLPVEYL